MPEIPNEIKEIIERFERNIESYRSASYKEAQLRLEFINPFFEALGWDVYNKEGHDEAYKDVIHEDAIHVGGATKAPDYCFRIGGTRKFFVETKKPSVDITAEGRGEGAPAYQLRRYAWSAKLPLSILTDFEEFAVYDCRIRPKPTDKTGVARVFFCTYKEYPEKWEHIAGIFSKKAVLQGSFDRYAESALGKRGTSQVDAEFLKEIEGWRDALARHIALRNPDLSVRELNYAVQTTIDRIIFLRMAEDRGIEQYGQLQTLLNGTEVYSRLRQFYDRADERYNSGLFHFQKEKDRDEPPDELTPRLKIDDAVLRDIVKGLYYPESPYEFSVLGGDILGNVYEQFLGKVIRLTSGHQAKVEEKSEVKKAGGVYYTPAYIVDYIVKNTVGKLCEGKTPKQVAKFRVLDPACGSGSFLIGAYTYLLDWHRDWYVQDGPEKHTNEIYQGHGGQWYLTTRKKKEILLNNIYGVDIDSQAVEVTKLNLLLKLLEGENQDTLERQFKLFRERALPDLASNIKCGNSLIGPDFFQNHQGELFDDEDRYRINAFDWQNEFSETFGADGFDAVISNPPWGASFTAPELAYLRKHYARVIARMIDSYIYFIDRASQLAKSDAPIGFIVPSTILNQVDAQPIRELLLKRNLNVLMNLGQGIFGAKVLNTSTVFISGIPKRNALILANLSDLALSERASALTESNAISWRGWKKQVEDDPHRTFFTGPLNGTALLQRLRRQHPPLRRFISGSIQRGVSPDVVAAHVVSKSKARALRLEAELLRASVSGSQIKRYREWEIDQFIIYTSRETRIKNYPRVLKHLEQFRKANTCKEVEERKHAWWSLHRARDPRIFASPKFIGLTTSKTIELIYDSSMSAYVTDAMYVFSAIPGVDPRAFMAIMQSKLFLFLYRVSNQGESRVIPQVKASKLDTLPVPVCDKPHPLLTKITKRSQQMNELEKKLAIAKTPQEKIVLQRQITATDKQIDVLVYELYGLNEEEIAIVEEAKKKSSELVKHIETAPFGN